MRLNQTDVVLLFNVSSTASNTTAIGKENEDFLATFRLPLSLMASGVIVGNSLVCALFCRFRKLRTITNTFVVSLAVSDCLVAVVFVPCFLLQGQVKYVQLLVPYIIGYILFAYLFNFCGVTYDRYQAIVKPLSYNAKITRSSVNKILIVVWMVPFAMTLVPATWENQPPKTKALAQRINQGFLIFLVTVLAVIIFMAYVKIFRETRKQVKWMFSAVASSAGKALHCSSTPAIEKNTLINEVKKLNKTKKFSLNIAAEVKAAKVFAVLIITFLVCWLPLIIINIIEALGFRSSVPSKLIEVSLFTLVFNSLIDPFIYSLYKSDFRRALRRVCGSCIDVSRNENEFTSNCSNSYNRDSFRAIKLTSSSAVNTKGSSLTDPLNDALSTETFL